MKLTQRVENREITQRKANLKGNLEGKYLFPYLNNSKSDNSKNMNENKTGNTFPMRTITLRGVEAEENRKEGPAKQLTDVEFQAQREKGLCFRCDEKYHSSTNVKSRNRGSCEYS